MAEVLLEDQKRCLFENKLEELLKTCKGQLPVAVAMVKAILQQLQLETKEEKSILETKLAQTDIEKEQLDWARTVVKQELKSVENDWNKYGNYVKGGNFDFQHYFEDCGYGALRLRKKQLQETMNNLNDIYRTLWTDIHMLRSRLGKLINEEIARVQRIHILEIFQSMPHLLEGHDIFFSCLQELEKIPVQTSMPSSHLKPDLIKQEPNNILNTERVGCTFKRALRKSCNKDGLLEVYNDMIDTFEKKLPKLSPDSPSSDCEKFLANILKGHACRLQRERMAYSLLSQNLTGKPDHLVPAPEDEANIVIQGEENKKMSSPNWCKEINKVEPSVHCVQMNLENENVIETSSMTDQLCPENMDSLSLADPVDCQIEDAVSSKEENCKKPKNKSIANITSNTKSAITKKSIVAKISKANKEKKCEEKERVQIIELDKCTVNITGNESSAVTKKSEHAEHSTTFKETIGKEKERDGFMEKVEYNISDEVSENPVLSKKKIKNLEQRSDKLEALMAEFHSQLLDLRSENRHIIEKLDQTHGKLSEQKNVGEEVVITYDFKEMPKQDLEDKMQGLHDSHQKKVGEEVNTSNFNEMLDQCCETAIQGSHVSDTPQQQNETDKLKHIVAYEPCNIEMFHSTNRAPGACDNKAKNFEECEKLRAAAEVAPRFDVINPCLDSLVESVNSMCKSVSSTSTLVDSTATNMATPREAEMKLSEELLRKLLGIALDHKCHRCCSDSSASNSDSDSKSE